MKKNYFLVIILGLFSIVNAQIINFPDAILKNKLLAASATNSIAKDLSGNFFKIDANNNGEIEVAEAQAVSYLNVNCTLALCTDTTKITDLSGIANFINLEFFSCNINRLTTADVLSNVPTTLKVLRCNSNIMHDTVDLSPFVNLEEFSCGSNYITGINVSNCLHLKYLECSQNNLAQLNVVSNTALENLYCNYNDLTGLYVNYLVNLKVLECQSNAIISIDLWALHNLTSANFSYNQLTNLNISGNPNLTNLHCAHNAISTLNIAGCTNLTNLYCEYNAFSALDLTGCPNLKVISCNNNQITSLDISQCTILGILKCDNNMISSLDITTHGLESIEVNNNQLTTLDITGNPNIMTMNCMNNQLISIFAKGSILTDPDMGDFFVSDWRFSGNPGLQYFCCDDSREAQVRARTVTYGYTNCVVNSYCSFVPGGQYYTIQGNNKFDADNNGCDAADMVIPNMKYTITGGITAGTVISSTSGHYFIPVQVGSHTVTPIIQNPSFFTISPNSLTVDFPTQTSPFTQDFCIAANGSHSDLETILIPLGTARPGFDCHYRLVYSNKGNQVQSGTINLTFESNVLDLVASSSPVQSETGDVIVWDFNGLLPFETRSIMFTMNANSPTDIPALNAGDLLSYTAVITSGVDEVPENNTALLEQGVTNSLDPNDKTCLEGNVITPEMVGKEVHYMIRFENTGTANAENIVVKDMIDTTKFDINSLIPMDGSASFVTKVSGNKVEFMFENINLPFDDANNDGYVAFKIKTKSNLVLGNTFSNTASIYFDYNAPIITNTATTTVALLTNTDFAFEQYFKIYPNPVKDVLNIETKKTIEVTSVNIYNTLGQLVLIIPSAQQTKSIDVSGLKTGNYFIKVNSDQGTSNTRFIKQ